MISWKSVFALGLCASASFAQVVIAPPPSGAIGAYVTTSGPMTMKLDHEAAFIGAEFGVETKVVKGLPYSAQAVTESTQTLADGNRIVHKSTTSIARDSEGRTRREQSLTAIGPWATGKAPGPLVFINDPVAQATYVLNSDAHTVDKMGHSGIVEFKTQADMRQTKLRDEAKALAITGNAAAAAQMAVESLGSKVIEGVQADGKRFTRTVPAGQMGNEKPLVYVNETWTSTDLGGVVVMSLHSDPIMGETKYTLTNISRVEPAPSLFSVPADYTVRDPMRTVTTISHEE